MSDADIQWDVISGISAGAVNAALMTGWPKGSENEMSMWLSELYKSIATKNIWEPWPEGVLDRFGSRLGLLDSSPAQELLEKVLS